MELYKREGAEGLNPHQDQSSQPPPFYTPRNITIQKKGNKYEYFG
jgi:hypothetical protein